MISTHKYDDTKVSVSQLPLVKTLKPLVRRMTTHKNNATHELYT